VPELDYTREKTSFENFAERAVSTESCPSYLPITAEAIHAIVEVAAATAALLDLYKKSLYNATLMQQDIFDARLKRAQKSLACLAINSPGDNSTGPNDRLMLSLLGIFTEAGELLEAADRNVPFDAVSIKEELGDLNWYQALALDALGSSLEEVLAMNVAKLRVRYGGKFTVQASVNRDLVAEQEALRETQSKG
jgi:NTP pyrophosphatase (non-canonical NTP hydrolase)